MILKSFTAICLLGLLLACNSKSKSPGAATTDSASGKQEPAANGDTKQTPPGDESFETFLAKFNTDKEFQLARVQFPFNAKERDCETGKLSTRSIKATEWKTEDFSYDASYAKRELDAYTQKTVLKGDGTAVIEMRGVDNGIAADHLFTLVDGKWYYTGILNESC
jgi:hypothetical protein